MALSRQDPELFQDAMEVDEYLPETEEKKWEGLDYADRQHSGR